MHFQSKDDLRDVINQSRLYLDKYVEPHNLVSYSIFEEDHPNAPGLYHSVILFKGNGTNESKKPDDTKTIYQIDLIPGDEGWETLLSVVTYKIDETGFDQTRYQVSTMNTS